MNRLCSIVGIRVIAIVGAAAFICVTDLAVRRASAGAFPIGPGAFPPTATVYGFEERTNTGLPTNPDFNIIRLGSPSDLPWFDGSTASSFDMFGKSHFANLISESTSDFAIRFTNLQPAVGLWVGQVHNYLGKNTSQVLFRILDDNGGLIASESVSLPSLGSPPVFVGFSSDIPIRRAEVIGDHIGFFGVDNITYSVIVPEPTSRILLVIGLIALAVRSGLPASVHPVARMRP